MGSVHTKNSFTKENFTSKFPVYTENYLRWLIYPSWSSCVTKWEIYIRVPPFTYSVKANATKPNMANLPFHSSAFEVITPSDLDSTLTPLNKGIRDAKDSRMLVPRNHGIPPLDIWVNTSWPLDNSTANAETNPIIASLPLILSGAGPLNANTSENFVLTYNWIDTCQDPF